ncbi:MAG: splicing factor, CC1-like family [Francisellaceae bacterium]|nr:splicing factor, CC1-like family [Francisellaceae bacterium]
MSDPIFFLNAFIVISVLLLIISFVNVRKQSFKQSKQLSQFNTLIKLQEITNQRLVSIRDEIKKNNYLLSNFSGVSLKDMPKQALNDTSSVATLNNFPIENNHQGKLYVGNVDYSVSESELADLFSKFGQIDLVNIPINRYTGRARGFGFVTFVSPEDAEKAMNLNGTEFKGRQIQVNFAKEKDLNVEA